MEGKLKEQLIKQTKLGLKLDEWVEVFTLLRNSKYTILLAFIIISAFGIVWIIRQLFVN